MPAVARHWLESRVLAPRIGMRRPPWRRSASARAPISIGGAPCTHPMPKTASAWRCERPDKRTQRF